MKTDKILKELNLLKEQAEAIVEKVEILKKELGLSSKKSPKIVNVSINKSSTTKTLFIDYLRNVSKLKDRSISNYITDLKRLKYFIEEFTGDKLDCEIFDMDDLSKLKKISKKLYANKNFYEINMKSHHRFSASLNNYIHFLELSNNSFDFDD